MVLFSPILFYFLHTNGFNAAPFFFFRDIGTFPPFCRHHHTKDTKSYAAQIFRNIRTSPPFCRHYHTKDTYAAQNFRYIGTFPPFCHHYHTKSTYATPPPQKKIEIVVRSPILSALPYKNLLFLYG